MLLQESITNKISMCRSILTRDVGYLDDSARFFDNSSANGSVDGCEDHV